MFIKTDVIHKKYRLREMIMSQVRTSIQLLHALVVLVFNRPIFKVNFCFYSLSITFPVYVKVYAVEIPQCHRGCACVL